MPTKIHKALGSSLVARRSGHGRRVTGDGSRSSIGVPNTDLTCEQVSVLKTANWVSGVGPPSSRASTRPNWQTLFGYGTSLGKPRHGDGGVNRLAPQYIAGSHQAKALADCKVISGQGRTINHSQNLREPPQLLAKQERGEGYAAWDAASY